MTEPETKHPRETVLPVAERLLASLAPACNEAVIAGSLRREKQFVTDIEICLLPIFEKQSDLFGETATTRRTPLLDSLLAQFVADGVWCLDSHIPRNGVRYKRLFLPEIGIACELFLGDETNFGDILAIRTGSAAYSKWFMTPRRFDGSLPDDMAHTGGNLYRFSSVAAAMKYRKSLGGKDTKTLMKQAVMIPCPTEEAFFDAIRVPFRHPRDREEV